MHGNWAKRAIPPTPDMLHSACYDGTREEYVQREWGFARKGRIWMFLLRFAAVSFVGVVVLRQS